MLVSAMELSTLLIALIALFLASWATYAMRQQHKKWQNELALQEKEIAALKSELCNVSIGALGVGQRLKSVEKRISSPDSPLEGASVSEGGGPYRKALKLVENGAPVEVLIDQCGLTRAEAELLCLMHQSLSGDP